MCSAGAWLVYLVIVSCGSLCSCQISSVCTPALPCHWKLHDPWSRSAEQYRICQHLTVLLSCHRCPKQVVNELGPNVTCSHPIFTKTVAGMVDLAANQLSTGSFTIYLSYGTFHCQPNSGMHRQRCFQGMRDDRQSFTGSPSPHHPC